MIRSLRGPTRKAALLVSAGVLLGTLLIGAAAAQTDEVAPGEEKEASATPEATMSPAASPADPAPDAPLEPVAPDPATDARVAAAGVTIEAVDDRFVPKSVTVDAGTTLAWRNTGANLHTVTAEDGSFDSGLMSAGDTFTVVVDEPGAIAYFCSIHGGPGGAGMAGVVTVRAAAPPSPADDDGTGSPAGGGAGALPATGANVWGLFGVAVLTLLLAWTVQALGTRAAYTTADIVPRDAIEARDADLPGVKDAQRAYMANRGVWDFGWWGGPTLSVAHTDADIDLYLEVFGGFLSEVVV